MKEGLLFNRVDVHSDQLTIYKAIEDPVFVLPDSTNTSFPVLNEAIVRTEKTPQLFFIEFFVKHCLFHTFIIAGNVYKI